MSTKINALFNKVIIKADDLTSKKNELGLYMPESADNNNVKFGTVIEVGAGNYQNGQFVATTVKKGDRVVFAKYSSTLLKIDGVEYDVINETDIIAVLGEEE